MSSLTYAKEKAISEVWLVMKRGLYYMPNDCGYTGIRDHAGKYTHEEALLRCHGEGVSMVRFHDAPEYTTACYDDLARNHLTKQRDEARAESERLSAAIRQFADPANWHQEAGLLQWIGKRSAVDFAEDVLSSLGEKK